MTGCASQSNWSPTVDSYGDPNAANIGRDNVECRQLAKSAAGDAATETGKGALIGGALGAATGAIFGLSVGLLERVPLLEPLLVVSEVVQNMDSVPSVTTSGRLQIACATGVIT